MDAICFSGLYNIKGFTIQSCVPSSWFWNFILTKTIDLITRDSHLEVELCNLCRKLLGAGRRNLTGSGGSRAGLSISRAGRLWLGSEPGRNKSWAEFMVKDLKRDDWRSHDYWWCEANKTVHLKKHCCFCRQMTYIEITKKMQGVQ